MKMCRMNHLGVKRENQNHPLKPQQKLQSTNKLSKFDFFNFFIGHAIENWEISIV